MKGARTVVAINNDPKAPIHAEADYTIVGDLYEIVPACLEASRARPDGPASGRGSRWICGPWRRGQFLTLPAGHRRGARVPTPSIDFLKADGCAIRDGPWVESGANITPQILRICMPMFPAS